MIKNVVIVLFFLLATSGWLAALNAMALLGVNNVNDSLTAMEMLPKLPENDNMRLTLAYIVHGEACSIRTQPEALLFLIGEWRTTALQRAEKFFEQQPELYQKVQKDSNCKK